MTLRIIVLALIVVGTAAIAIITNYYAHQKSDTPCSDFILDNEYTDLFRKWCVDNKFNLSDCDKEEVAKEFVNKLL
jgi:hypothetical protein